MKHKRRGIRREGTLFGEKAGMIAAISVLCIIVIGVSVYMIRNKDSGIIRRRDEVLEIENLNPRDNVVEAEDFEDKDVSWKEKRKLKKEAKKEAKKETAKASDEKTQSNSENSGSSEDGSGESGNTENGGSQNQGGDTENPDGTETPDTPSLPVVEEPGWTIGIY